MAMVLVLVLVLVLVQQEQQNKFAFLIDSLFQLGVCFSNSFSAGSWDDVFKVAVALYIIGTLVWNLFSTGEKIIE
jgi:hypothetical protein